MRIGIDLGGTKIEGIAIDDGGVELLRRRVPSPRREYAETLTAIGHLVTEIEAELGCKATVGVCTPGAISPASGRIKNANSTNLIGHPLDRDLSAHLSREVRLSNDANCFALSEAVDGAGAHAHVVFGVILGTGVGGGVVVGKRVRSGPNAIRGEWGHNPIPWPQNDEMPGSPCYCGRSGCIETFLSGPAMANDFSVREGMQVSAEDIIARSASDDPAALRCVERYEDRLARGLASVINMLDPDAIVLGGGLSNVARFYETIPRLWSEYVFSDKVDTPLLAPKHGDSSGVRGAAWLWPL